MRNVTYINAGAGSGKTYTLTELLSDVLQKKQARPEEVILTTFTEKASNDFKEKSKSKLFEKGLFEEANMLDGALIGTIHSVAYSIISKFWYYLGLPPKPQIMTEEDGVVYRAQSLGTLPTKEELDFLKQFAEKFEIKEPQSAAIDYNFWQGHLKAIIGFTTNYEITDYNNSRVRSKASFEEFVNPDAPSLPSSIEIIEALEILGNIFNNQKESDSNNKRKESVRELKRKASRPTYALYKELLKLGQALKSAATDPFIASINERIALMWQSKDVYDDVAEYIDVVFNLAERWRTQYEAFKKQRNILDFDDLEKYLLNLLRTPFAAKEIGAKYRYVFVDEFQDCSPIQIKIFKELSQLAEHSYWVGDMKQSIFGFRGSDTSLTDAVIKTIKREKANGCIIKTLPNSWRSVPEIVDFCNGIFVKAFAPDIPEDRVRLEPVKESDPSVEPLILWNVDGEEKLTDLIAHLIEEKVAPSEIAVLNRRGDPLTKIGELLTEANIPVNLSTEPIMSSKAAKLAKAILNAADNDADSLAKGEVAFLLDSRYSTGNLISETLAHINPETGRPDHSFLDEIPVLKRLSEIRNRLSQQSVAEFVESMILELNLFEEAMKCSPRKECVKVLNTIIDAAKTFEEISLRLDTTPTVKGFIDYLSGDELTLPGDPDGVVLLTMHKSKGLEWKHVIVTSLSSNPANVKSIMKREVFGVHFRRNEKPSCDDLFPEVFISLMPFIYGSGNTNVPAPLDGIIQNKPQFEQICKDKIDEETRLLYVAMTRPTHQLILSLKGKSPLRWLDDIGLLEFSDGDALRNSFGFIYCGYDTKAEIEETVIPKLTYPVGNAAEGYEKRDYSPSLLNGKSPVKSHTDFGRRIPLCKLPKDVEMDTVGNCIHQIYRLCQNGYPEESAVRNLISAYGLTVSLCDINEIRKAWDRLMTFIEEHHGKIVGHDHERPFIMHNNGKVYTGSIDLTVETSDGLVLIDFKTCPLGNDRILDEDNDHYAGLYGGQVDCYRTALTHAGIPVLASYLYYPISGLLIEL